MTNLPSEKGINVPCPLNLHEALERLRKLHGRSLRREAVEAIRFYVEAQGAK
jgi:hypothetical protein